MNSGIGEKKSCTLRLNEYVVLIYCVYEVKL